MAWIIQHGNLASMNSTSWKSIRYSFNPNLINLLMMSSGHKLGDETFSVTYGGDIDSGRLVAELEKVNEDIRFKAGSIWFKR